MFCGDFRMSSVLKMLQYNIYSRKELKEKAREQLESKS